MVSVVLAAVGCAYDQVVWRPADGGPAPAVSPLPPSPPCPVQLTDQATIPGSAAPGQTETSTASAPVTPANVKDLETAASAPPTAAWADEPAGLSPALAAGAGATVDKVPDPSRAGAAEVPAAPAMSGTSPELLPRPRKADTPEPVAMHVDDLDVRKALEILSRESSLNIVVSPNVSGRVTANLHGLSPDQALDAILHLSHLVAQREQGIVYVYSAAEVSKTDDQERKLPVRVYHLNYVRSTDLAAMIKPLLSTRGKLTTTPTSAAGIGSSTQTAGSSSPSAGSASPGNGASANGSGPAPAGPGGSQDGGDSLAGGDVLIVQDQESVLRTIDLIVTQVDVAPVQVLIEAVIMNVTLSKDHELGVNFGVLDAGHALGVLGNGALLNAAVGFSPAGVLAAGGQVTGTSSTGFAADEHGLKFGFVDRNVTGFIRALDQIGRTEILACPRLLVLNKQRAELQLGDRLGYSTLSQNLTSTVQQVEFLDTGTLLRVRPFISSDGMVRMEIHPERSSGQIVNNIPQTSTSEVTTNVMVPDGATIVIGGLMENVDDHQMSGVPGLCKLPVIGASSARPPRPPPRTS